MPKKPSRWLRVGAVAAAAALCVGLGGGVAQALWSANTQHALPGGMTSSQLQFGGSTDNLTQAEQIEYSVNGESIELVIPGSTVIEVLGQDEPDSAPIIWRFNLSGFAPGIAGLNYDIAVTEQRSADGSHAIVNGQAAPDTVLEQSTLQVYPAGAGGDCSVIPALPEGAVIGDTNVFVHDGTDAVLQAPGAGIPGSSQTDDWCVALNWNSVADGLYVNDVSVNGTAEDGSQNGGIAQWFSRVGTPPSLAMLGEYLSEVMAEGMAEDTTLARDTDQWGADVYPDPSNEPAVVLTITPKVTSESTLMG